VRPPMNVADLRNLDTSHLLGVSGADTVSRMGCGSRGSEARPRLFRDLRRGSD